MVGSTPLNEEFLSAIGTDADCRNVPVAMEAAQRLIAEAGGTYRSLLSRLPPVVFVLSSRIQNLS